MKKPKHIAVIGGGAAGYFAAIAAAENASGAKVTIYESSKRPLRKVKISGGGRCNVTHACFDSAELINCYPRGSRELRGPFTRFQPSDTVEWFERRGVKLKSESDGRMFPVTDNSQTIIDCLRESARDAGVSEKLSQKVTGIESNDKLFTLFVDSGESVQADRILLATGSSGSGRALARELGHTITTCVPSLFTFKVKDERIDGLSGVSFPDVRISIDGAKDKALRQRGPLLITHWGFSGPAALKLSAWGARAFSELKYHCDIVISFMPDMNQSEVLSLLKKRKLQHARKKPGNDALDNTPARYWKRIVSRAGVTENRSWADVTRAQMDLLAIELSNAKFHMSGKSAFKEEFVTCGGVKLSEVDFKTMQSKITPGLYFAGEVLDIDGITGGYNFQSAWTTGYIAGRSFFA